MGFVAVKCPSCGAEVNLDEDREFGFCTYCGTKIVQEKIVVEHRGQVSVDGIATKETVLDRADICLAHGEFAKAKEYYNKALDLDPKSSDCYWKLLLCKLKVKNDKQLIQRYGKRFENPIDLENYADYLSAIQFATPEQKERIYKIKNQIDLSSIEVLIKKTKDRNVIFATGLFVLIVFAICFAFGKMTIGTIICLVIAIVYCIIIIRHDKVTFKKAMTPEQYAKFNYFDIYKKK